MVCNAVIGQTYFEVFLMREEPTFDLHKCSKFREYTWYRKLCWRSVLGSIVVSIPACHAGDRGSIPRRGGTNF